MKVLVVGGGSGGHITPAVAVIREILELKPRTRVEFWTDRKYYKNVVKITTEIGVRWGSSAGEGKGKVPYIRVRRIAAGKFHRYAGWGWKDWLKEWRIVLKDLIWGEYCWVYRICWWASAEFLAIAITRETSECDLFEGGFVGLPVGLAARLLRIPYVVHESDVVPGLANRLLMRHATVVATGFAELLGAETVVQVGTPVAPEFKSVSEAKQKTLKKAFGFDPDRPLVVVTGGSQGALSLDEAMTEILPEMLKFTSVGLVAGRKHYENMVELKKYEEWDHAKLQSNFRMWEFNSAMHELMGAADVVVSRAGATTIAELAALEKAVVLVPYEMLPGGHQTKNAEKLAAAKAVIVVPDARMREQPGILLNEVRHLVRSPKERQELAEKLHVEAKPDAALRLARVVLEVGESTEKK